MDDNFELYKKLNKKKVAIAIIIILIIIILIVNSIVHYVKSSQKITEETNSSTVTFFDKNNELSIRLSKKYNLSLINSTETNHVLELSSPLGLNISISKEELIINRSLYDIIENDKDIFIKNFSNVSNVSDISNIEINNMQAYTYSFNYINQESQNTLYLQSIWIQNETNYFIIDIAFINDNFQDFNNIFKDIISSLKIE